MKGKYENLQRGTTDFAFSKLYFHCLKPDSITAILHWHPDIEIIYITEGSAQLSTGSYTAIMRKGDVFFINPDQLHMITSIEVPLSYYAFVFSPTVLTFGDGHFFNDSFITPLCAGKVSFPEKITAGDSIYPQVNRIVNSIIDSQSTDRHRILLDLLTLCVLLVEKDRMLINRVSYDGTYENLKLSIEYMRMNYSKRITLSELAGSVHLSENYFCTYFKRATGLTPFEQLNSIRIDSAAELISHTDKSILQISLECGFENVSHFIRQFKKLKGVTPSEYRKKLK